MHVVQKPWGHYEDHLRTPELVIKTITIQPGGRLSLQWHARRREHWYVLSGEGIADIGEFGARVKLLPHRSLDIIEGLPHRIQNDGSVPLVIAEIQTGDCDESDIVRTEDDYGRIRGAI